MQPPKLSNNEKLVLYGMVRYPEYNDIQMADKMGVKRPTVTKIKGKLIADGFVGTFNFPNYYAAGAEVLLFYHIYHSKQPGESLELPDDLKEVFNMPSLIHVRSGGDSLGLAVFKDYAHLQSTSDMIVEEMMLRRLIKKRSIFPFALKLVQVPIYFETAYLVDRAYGMNMFEDTFKELPIPDIPPALSAKEQNILEAFVRYPYATDTLISDKLGVARPTVSEKRNSFFNSGTLKRVNLPSFSKLGYEILCYCMIPHNKKLDARVNVDTLGLIREIMHPILIMDRHVECFCIFVAKDYTEYHKIIEELDRRRNQNIGVEMEPLYFTVSTNYIEGLEINLANPLRGIFERE